jgi:hypothetical protein
MMRKAQLLKEIFAELRAGLGPEVAASDVIKIAHVILRSYSEEIDNHAQIYFGRSHHNFSSMPVDLAMKDGGWRIMEFELENNSKLDDINPAKRNALRHLIEKHLGPEWQHQTLQGQL